MVALMRVMTQYALRQNADTLVISVNPRHSAFYRKMMGFVPLGPWRAYPAVQNHPAEAYLLNVDLLQQNLDEEESAAKKVLAAAQVILKESAAEPESRKGPKSAKEKYSDKKSKEDEKKAAGNLHKRSAEDATESDLDERPL